MNDEDVELTTFSVLDEIRFANEDEYEAYKAHVEIRRTVVPVVSGVALGTRKKPYDPYDLYDSWPPKVSSRPCREMETFDGFVFRNMHEYDKYRRNVMKDGVHMDDNLLVYQNNINDYNLVREYYNAGQTTDMMGGSNLTPLKHAIVNQANRDTIRFLSEVSDLRTASSEFCRSPIQLFAEYARENEDVEIMEILCNRSPYLHLNKRFKTGGIGGDIGHSIVQSGNFENIIYYAQFRSRCPPIYELICNMARNKVSVDIFRVMINKIDKNYCHFHEALFFAIQLVLAKDYDVELVRICLEAGANPNYRIMDKTFAYTTLHCALGITCEKIMFHRAKSPAIYRLLCDYGANCMNAKYDLTMKNGTTRTLVPSVLYNELVGE